MNLLAEQLTTEFDRQVATLLEKQYPQAAGMSPDDFLKQVEPLRKKLGQISVPEADIEQGKLPFVIVVTHELISSETMMSLVEREGKKGVTILRPHTTAQFNIIEEATLPNKSVYLLVDIDRGKETINLPPSEALKIIKTTNRSPLTIDEGIAILTHFPNFLIKNNCFSLLASRTGQDKRVPALWINANKHPNLGWCWNGNPHTWLGSASCRERLEPL